VCVCSFVCQSINRWSASSITFVNHNYKYKNTGCFQLAPVISSKVDLLQRKEKAVRVLIVILKADNLRNARAKLDSILGTLQCCFIISFLHTTTTKDLKISSRQRNDFASVFIWEGAVAWTSSRRPWTESRPKNLCNLTPSHPSQLLKSSFTNDFLF